MKRVDHEDAILRTFILFVQTARAVLKYADARFFRKARLSAIKYIVLQILAINGGTMTPSEIAEWTLTERHNITTLANRLERDGLVRAERNDRDRRFVNITLTDKGRQVLSEATPVARQIVNQAMLSIAEGDAVLLEKLLETLRRNVHYGLEQVAKQPLPRPD